MKKLEACNGKKSRKVMIVRRKGRLLAAMLGLTMLLAGCAESGQPSEDNSGIQQETRQAGEVIEGGELYVNEYIPLLAAEPEGGYTGRDIYADISGNRLYILSVYYMPYLEGEVLLDSNVFSEGEVPLEGAVSSAGTVSLESEVPSEGVVSSAGTDSSNGEVPLEDEVPSNGAVSSEGTATSENVVSRKAGKEYYLSIFDGESRKMEQHPISLEIPDLESSYIASMEVTGQKELSFRMKNNADPEGHGFLVKTDLEGKLLSCSDTFPEASAYPWNPEMGEQRMVFDTGGSTILSEWDLEEGTNLSWYDPEGESRRMLASLEGEILFSLCLDKENSMYYIADNDLFHWDMESNARQRFLNIRDIGVPDAADFTGLLTDSEGRVMVCALEGNALGVFVLSEDEAEVEDEIRMVYLGLEQPYMTKLATGLSRQHTECPIRIEKSSGDETADRDRIFMELAAGRGPELMVVSKEDMRILEEKDALLDLTELIPHKVMEQLWPCVIADTTINGKMVGIETYFSIDTMVAANQVWEKDTWTLDEFLEIAESRTDWELIFGGASRLDGYSLFCNITRDLAHSPFLDLEQGQSHFDREEFRNLLEMCRKYGGRALHSAEEAMDPSRKIGWEEADRILREGNCIAEASYMYGGFSGFSSVMEKCGDSVHIVGYPSNTGSGNYCFNSEGYLVVNREAAHLEEIKAYIALLLDYDNQFEVPGSSVRRDVAENCLFTDERDPGRLWERKGKKGESIVKGDVTLKPDGTSYLEEYIAFLENCVPAPETPSGISKILWEELDAYLAGEKSVEDTVEIIQNRVQLYLDERSG